MTPESVPALETRGLTKRFGGLTVNAGLDLRIAPGEARAVIGPNGAGKTTLINQIAGHLRPDQGEILFQGGPIAGWPPYRIARLGIGRSFQQTNLFSEFSVFENVRLAAQSHLPRMLRVWRGAGAYGPVNERAEQALETVGLAHRRGARAGGLSHGEQRQLELAMVLALRPKLLLLDEPMAGLSLEESRRITELLLELKRDHTILLIEHDMDAVFAIADRITVLVHGQEIATGDAEAVRTDPAVIEAYLGED
ncbi:MAG: ABC transporter ATP-binding protein [SAR324 cluster bacterium]|nr:ABC transporter ATP-binding protein [SAR324 cluster bacterium]